MFGVIGIRTFKEHYNWAVYIPLTLGTFVNTTSLASSSHPDRAPDPRWTCT
jgi:hypothetical protein